LSTQTEAGPGAGPELDSRMAQEVLGWQYQPRFPQDVAGYYLAPDGPIISEELPAFSGDLNAALLIIMALRDKGWHIVMGESVVKDHWIAEFQQGDSWWYDPDTAHKARADTLPLAICRAALAVLAAS
jgi:hypothetical protein